MGSCLHSGLLLLFSGQFELSFPSTLSDRQYYLLPDLPRASYISVCPAYALLAPHSEELGSSLNSKGGDAECTVCLSCTFHPFTAAETLQVLRVLMTQRAPCISLDYQDRNIEPARGWGTAHGFPAAGDTRADTLLEPMRLRPAGQYNESSTQK